MQSFRYASGPCRTDERTAASAFSIGDILLLDSTSSVSRVPPTWASGVDWYGIAGADSTASINGKVQVQIPEADTHLWVSLDSALGSHVTRGVEGDVIFAAANGRYYFTTSANSVRAVVVRGTEDVSQSIESKVLVRLIKHAGNAEL